MHLQGVEGQQLAAVVSELLVHLHQAQVVGEVSEVQGELVLGAVHLAEVQEGRQSVDLLSLGLGLSTEVIGRESGSAGRSGSEGRDAAVRARREAWVAGRNLFGRGEARFIEGCLSVRTVLWKNY